MRTLLKSIRTNCERSAPFLETNFPESPGAVRASCGGGGRSHVGRLGRFSKLRQKMPSCPMHLADTMKFRPYLTVRTVTACVSTSCISASSGKWTTRWSAAREIPFIPKWARAFVDREGVCGKHSVPPQERISTSLLRPRWGGIAGKPISQSKNSAAIPSSRESARSAISTPIETISPAIPTSRATLARMRPDSQASRLPAVS